MTTSGLLAGVALVALVAASVPASARNQAAPAAGAVIIPPADPAAAKPLPTPAATAPSPASAAAAPTSAAPSPAPASAAPSPAAAVAATAIRHDRAPHRRYVWHRRRIRHRPWRYGARGDRVAEALNFDELHRVRPSPSPRPPAPLR